MKILDICVKREFTKNGETKLNWYKVGSLKIADSGKQYIRLYHQPQTEFFVFDQSVTTQEQTQEAS
jgi:hypothetical protein